MDLGTTILYSLIPAATATGAFFISFFTKLRESILHVIQAIGSGVLLSAIIFAVVPRFINSPDPVSILILLPVGFLLMLAIKSMRRPMAGAMAGMPRGHGGGMGMPGGHGGGMAGAMAGMPGGHGGGMGDATAAATARVGQFSFLLAFCVEFFVNGLLIGVTSTFSAKNTALIAFSICVCSFACAMSFVTKLIQSNYSKASTVVWAAGMIGLFPLGALLGHVVLHSYMDLLPPILAFEVGVLVYLSILDLFVMATMDGIKRSTSVGFIGGFWLVLLIHYVI